MEQRFCFVSDDDGHKYLIPVELREEFNNELDWLNEHQMDCVSSSMAGKTYGEREDAFIRKFHQYMTGISIYNYTFTDPKENY